MFLIDTNCWMQMIRDRSLADEVRLLVKEVPAELICISIYSIHSIGIVMSRYGMIDYYGTFIRNAIIDAGVRIVGIEVPSLPQVAAACSALRLDFDDAYQYMAAEIHGLKLVSLDTDFDHTPNGRLTPAAARKLFKDEQQKPQQEA